MEKYTSPRENEYTARVATEDGPAFILKGAEYGVWLHNNGLDERETYQNKLPVYGDKGVYFLSVSSSGKLRKVEILDKVTVSADVNTLRQELAHALSRTLGKEIIGDSIEIPTQMMVFLGEDGTRLEEFEFVGEVSLGNLKNIPAETRRIENTVNGAVARSWIVGSRNDIFEKMKQKSGQYADIFFSRTEKDPLNSLYATPEEMTGGVYIKLKN